MEPSTPTKSTRPKSKHSLHVIPSTHPSPSTHSPDLLQTVQALQQRIHELENEGAKLSKADREELTRLQAEVTELKTKEPHEPQNREASSALRFGWF
jgi:hypothetical protein